MADIFQHNKSCRLQYKHAVIILLLWKIVNTMFDKTVPREAVMEKFSLWIIKHKTAFIIIFIVLLVGFAICIPFITFNYDDTSYLPDSSDTKAGLSVMKEEFGQGGSAYGMLENKNAGQALAIKNEILSVDGVAGVIWLDDIILPLLKTNATLTDTQKIEYFLRALYTLPKTPNATGQDVLDALSGEFSQTELSEILGLLSSLPEGIIDFSSGNLNTPLGLKYSVTVSALTWQTEKFYKDKNALFTISFAEGDYSTKTYNAINTISNLSSDLYLSGNSASSYYMQQNQLTEILNATILVAVVAIIVMLVFSSSWFDPVIYIIAIATAIVLNMGSNIIFDSVSYLTGSIAAALQLALSMDYAVFLLNRYKTERKEGFLPKDAMVKALTTSFSAISASSLTTIACFVTIMFMKFKLGLDMGLVMGKGIVFSLLTVFFLLPGVIIIFDKTLISTEHMALNFGARSFSKFIFKFRIPVVILSFAVIIPCAVFSGKNTFVYGSKSSQSPDSLGMINRNLIEETFGSQETLAILVPKDDEKEAELASSLSRLDGVVTATSYATLKNSGFDMLFPQAMTVNLVGKKSFNRIILTLDCEEEGEETKALIARIRDTITGIYGSNTKYYLLGNTAAAIDMENYTRKDFNKISWFSILAVGLIVALAFKSILIPIILVAVIEGAIWINMTIPYFMSGDMVFLGYMIISNILLGSTIDYAIIFASNYKEARQNLPVGETVRKAISETLRPIIISGGIFTICGLVVGAVSTFPTVKLLGFAIMRGGIFSVLLTITLTPALFAILDKVIFRKKKSKNTPE